MIDFLKPVFSKLGLLFLTLILGLSFVLLPNWDGVTYMNPDPFLFYDFGYSDDGRRLGICYQTYVYMICEYLVSIIFVGIIAKETVEYRQAVFIFLVLLCADLFDFLLDYNSVWFYIQNIPVSMNTTKCVIFGLVIIRELWNKSTGR